MSRIRPAKFVHVVYRTRRFDEMLDWYKKVFDAQVRHSDPAIAFLSYDDEHHRFAFINMSLIDPEGKQVDRKGQIGVDHVAYTFQSARDLFENYAQLKELGIKPYWTIHHGVTLSMYYADPDGNQMEFQVDSYQTNEDATGFMQGPGFAENPIGVEYDADAWLARIRAGEPADSFLLRTEHQPVSPVRGSALQS